MSAPGLYHSGERGCVIVSFHHDAPASGMGGEPWCVFALRGCNPRSVCACVIGPHLIGEYISALWQVVYEYSRRCIAILTVETDSF